MKPFPTSKPRTFKARSAARGSVYFAVLGLSTIIVVIAMGSSLAIRSQGRALTLQSDVVEARTNAAGAIEHAWQQMNTNAAWRTTFTNGAVVSQDLGRGTISAKRIDGADANLADDLLEDVRVYGYGRVGGATRVTSVLLRPAGPALAQLSYPVYSKKNITVTDQAVVDAALVAEGTCTVNLLAKVWGNVECGTFSLLGACSGTVTTGISPRTMPQGEPTYALYQARATAIPIGSIPSRTMQGKIISAASNPWGTANAAGIYFVDVPAGQTLTIRRCRLAATLVVNLGSGASLVTNGSNSWTPHDPTLPALIIRSTATASATLDGSATALTESAAGANLNPAGSPYDGVTDSDTSDSYPSRIKGVVHVIGGNVTTSVADLILKGTLVSEGSITLDDCGLARDTNLVTSPPARYISDRPLAAVPGTWRREANDLP